MITAVPATFKLIIYRSLSTPGYEKYSADRINAIQKDNFQVKNEQIVQNFTTTTKVLEMHLPAERKSSIGFSDQCKKYLSESSWMEEKLAIPKKRKENLAKNSKKMIICSENRIHRVY